MFGKLQPVACTNKKFQWESVEHAQAYVEAYGVRSLTDEQRTAVARRMFENGEAVVFAEKALGFVQSTDMRGHQLSGRILG